MIFYHIACQIVALNYVINNKTVRIIDEIDPVPDSMYFVISQQSEWILS